MLNTNYYTKWLFIFVSLLSASAVADDPDLAKEKRFHNLYRQYGTAPTSEEAWQNVTGQAQAQSYNIQTGDSLWALSETLFADPNFWPKIWSLNISDIENPHLIIPGQVLSFSPGSIDQPPSILVTDGQPEAEVPAAEPVPEKTPQELEQEALANVELPAPTREVTPVGQLPASLPSWKYRSGAVQSLKFEVAQVNRDFGKPEMGLPTFVGETNIPSLGTVVGAEAGNRSAITFQYVTVKLSSAPAEKTLLVVQPTVEIRSDRTKRVARVMQVQGVIEIGEVVNQKENLYRAMVTKSLNLVQAGALLVSGDIPTFNTQDDGDGVQLPARIIGGNLANGRLFGPENLVFLDVGTVQGANVGQSLPIYKQVPARVDGSKVIENPMQIGRMKIVNVSENFSTAVVTRASDEIHLGDTSVAGIANSN